MPHRRKDHKIQGEISFPVYYEDTDFSGFVYHTNYLKFFARAREHLIGVDYLHRLFSEGMHFVVYKMDVTFALPAKHGEIVVIESRCVYSRSPHLEFKQVAKRLSAHGTEMEKLVEASIDVVLLGKSNRPIRLPSGVMAHLQARALDSHDGLSPNGLS